MLTRQGADDQTIVLTPEEEAAVRAEWAANDADKAEREVAAEGKKAEREAILAETPVDVNSIPALRDEIDKLKSLLRGEQQ